MCHGDLRLHAAEYTRAMTAFVRAMALAALLGVVSTAQSPGTLHIKIVIADAGETTPVPGHALLISDNPPGAAPRVIRTAPDGTATVPLPPGDSTVQYGGAAPVGG